jgi:NADPH:quinone reductase-like Zn-dependent oxidoreductase
MSATQTRAVVVDAFGGPEVLRVQQVSEPHAGPGQLRVRVTAAGLNPMDWLIVADEAIGSAFGVRPPTGFGCDYAGVVDEVGEGVTGFASGDRVFGGAISRAVADHVVVDPTRDEVLHTPDGVDDVTAGTLAIAAATAAAALAAVGVAAGDTVLIGGAGGGVGVFAVQLAVLSGARVIGTASQGSFDFVRALGAEPVQYGAGLADRVRALAPGGITAGADLFGTEVAHAALELGVSPERIATIAAQDPELSAKAVGGADAAPGTLQRVADLIAQGRLTVPIAARYPIEQIREAVQLQAGRHARGKVVIVL